MTLFNSSNKNIIRSGNNKNSSRSTKTIISPNIYDAYSTQNNISREIKTNNEIIKRIRTKTYRVRRDEILKFKKISDMLIAKAKKESSKIFADMIENAQVEVVRQRVASKVQGYKEGFEEGKAKAMEEVKIEKDKILMLCFFMKMLKKKQRNL